MEPQEGPDNRCKPRAPVARGPSDGGHPNPWTDVTAPWTNVTSATIIGREIAAADARGTDLNDRDAPERGSNRRDDGLFRPPAGTSAPTGTGAGPAGRVGSGRRRPAAARLATGGALFAVGAVALVLAALAAPGRPNSATASPSLWFPASGAASSRVARGGSDRPSTAASNPVAPGRIVRVVETVRYGDRAAVAGDLLYILEQRPDAGGDPGYLIQHWGNLEQGIVPDTSFAVVRADILEAQVEAFEPACPSTVRSVLDVARLQPFERLVCFGGRELTIGPVIVAQFLVGARTSPRWLTADGRPDFFTGLPVYELPDGTLRVPERTWLEVSGRFDDPSSAGCGDTAEVTWCRERFVATGVREVEPPDFVLEGSWRATAVPPTGGRVGHAATWTGREMLVWGGVQSAPDPDAVGGFIPREGLAYDPSSDRWRRTSPAPIEGRLAPVLVWTGREAIAWGGYRAPGGDVPLVDGAAWDPSSDRWRKLPASPFGPSQAGAGWVAGRLVAVTDDGAGIYDPATNRWTAIEPPPVRPGWRRTLVAAGRLVVVAFGNGARDAVEVAVLDLANRRWTAGLAPLDPLTSGMDIAGTDGEVLFPGARLALDPVGGRWRSMVECDASGAAWTGRLLLGVYAAYDPAADRCRQLPEPPARAAPLDDTSRRAFPVGVWTGDAYVTWSGAVGEHGAWTPNDGAIFRPSEP